MNQEPKAQKRSLLNRKVRRPIDVLFAEGRWQDTLLRSNAARNGVLSGMNAVLGLGTALLLARALGASQYGVYSTAFVLASVLVVLVQFGLPNLVMRETAAAMAGRDIPAMYAVWKWATKAALTVSAVAVAVGATIVALWHGSDSFQELLTYAFALLLIPFIAIGSLRASALGGLQHVTLAQLPELLVKPGAMFMLALTLGTVIPAKMDVAMAMQLIAVVSAFVVGIVILNNKRPALPTGLRPAPVTHSKSHMKSAVYFAVVAGATRINQYVDILIIGALLTPKAVGIYRVVSQISLVAAFGNTVAASIIPARLAKHGAEKNYHAMKGVVRRGRLIGLAVAVPALALALTFGSELLSEVLGPEYAAGGPTLVVICFTYCANSFAGPLAPLLHMTGHERYSATVHAIAAGVNVGLNLALLPIFGIVGAAMATLASTLALNLLLRIKVRRVLHSVHHDIP